MKKKGFTLIEMLVVLVIIAIILTIAIPSVSKLKTRLTRKEYDTHVRLMKQALDSYTIKNQVKLKKYSNTASQKCVILDYSKLTDSSLLREKGVVCDGSVVLKSKENNQYDYEYYLNCYNETDKTKSHPIETYNPSDLARYNGKCTDLKTVESAVATLNSLTVEGHTLNRPFSSNIEEYEVNIGMTETSVKINAELTDSKASYKIIGDSNLKPGDNTVIVRVTAEDGTRKEYKITVHKEMSTSVALNSITSNVCELKYVENNDETLDLYECTVANNIKVANITAVPPTAGTSVIGTGTYELSVGANEVLIRVTSESGNEHKDYKITVTREGNSDTTLAILKTDVCEVEFNKDVTEYTCVVENAVDKIGVTAIPTATTSRVEGTGTTNLVVGENEVKVKVIAEDPQYTKEYVITVTRRPNTNVKLRSLTVSNCVLNPAFDKEITDYTCTETIPNGIRTVEVTAEKETDTGRVEGTGTRTLSVGNNVLEVKAIAEDGETNSVYKVTLYKNASSNAYLSNIGVTGYTISPAFNKTTLEYNVTVENNVQALNLQYALEDETAHATVTGNSNFVVGDNLVKIKVVAEDNMTEMNYIIKVHRKSNDATLKNLVATGYTLSPSYSANTTLYNITVENNIEEVNIGTEKNHALQEVTVTGNTGLQVGDNEVLIKVKAEDKTEKTYKIVVHRKSNDATLRSLGVTGYTLDPVYGANTALYNITVENNVTNVLVTSEKNHSSQTVTITGNTGLQVGDNEVLVKVKAEDGTEKTYKIVVHRKSNDATLRSLNVLGYELNPAYSANTTQYNLTVNNNVEDIVVEYERNHPSQTTVLSGNTGLQVGDNTVQIKVTAEDKTEKVYTIKVHKKSNDATLKSLGVTGYTISPAFDKEETNYKVTVGYATTQLPLTYEKTSPTATVTVVGNNLSVGENEVLVKVESEGGSEKIYKIEAYRKSNEARLHSLTVPGCTLSPDFDKNQLTYGCEVRYSVDKMTLEAETEDEKATITAIPVDQTINFGSNELKVTVTAEDTAYKKDYIITVTKNRDTRNKLLYLGVEGFVILTPEGEYFSSNNFEYEVETDATRLKIVAEPDSDVSTVVGDGEFNIGWGTVEKVITVTSQSGLPSQYRITIHNTRPTAPVLTVSEDDWVNGDVLVSITEFGEAASGVEEYEYYKTTSTTAPTDATEGQGTLEYNSDEETVQKLTLTESGKWYVYYRTISVNGNKSPWSQAVVAKIDKTKPVAPTGSVTAGDKINTASDWYTGNVTFKVVDGSDTLSGYDKSTYTLSGATTKSETEIANNGTITISNEGITTITLYGYDKVGIKSEARTYTVKIDRTVPTTGTLTVTSGTKTVSTSEWYTSDSVVVTVADGSDTTSGYWKTKYTLSGATTQSTKTDLNSSKTITITNEGATTITLYGYDNAGNEGTARTYTIKIDRTTPPNGTIAVTAGTEGTNGWYKSNPTVKLTQSTDALSGTDRITYKLTGAKTANETSIANNGTITIDTEGITTVTLYVYDKAGLKSTVTKEIKVDKVVTPPTISITGGTKGYENWYKDTVTVKVTGTDTTSDVAKVTYKLSGSTTKDETDLTNNGTFTVTNNGTTTVTAYTVDKAGNKSTAATLEVKKDTTGPSKTVKSTVTRETNKLTVAYSAVSATSGIYGYKCYYGTSNNPTTEGTVSGNNCVFSNLTADTLYYFKRCAISNSNVTVCSDVSSERTRHNFYTITVVNGKFSDGTTSKSIEATESVTVTANANTTNGWATPSTGTQEYREYYWDLGNSKTITVSKNETITFTEQYNVTKYKYKISFSGYSSLDRWTNDNGDKKFTFPAAQSKTGYTFQGWSTTNGATSGSAAGSTGTATGPTTYYPAWTANTYTVTLNKQSGTGGTDSVTATYDSAMPSATAPSRTGYTFGGYYTSTGGSGTQYYTSSMGSTRNWNLTSATTLYAKWTANQYTVTLNKQGGTGGTDSVTATYDSAMPSATAPSKTCYNFGGYYTGVDGTGTQYYTNAMASARTWNLAEAKTLYAYWPLASYSISYTLNGGSVSSSNPTSYTCNSSAITLNNPSRTGYTFTGWTGSNGTTAQTTVTIPTGSNGNKSYTANWSKNTYTLTYDYDGGSVSSANPSTYDVDTTTFTLINPTKTGYSFVGWAGSQNTPLLTVSGDQIPYASNYGLYYGPYYKTTAGYYTMDVYGTNLTAPSYNAYENTTSAVKMLGKITIDSTHVIIIMQAVSDPSTYGIEVSVSKPSGVTVTKEELRRVSTTETIAKGSTGNRSYKALWSLETYSITYDLAGGTVSTANPTSYTVNSSAITLNNPTRTGYTFAGWTGSNGTTAQTGVTIPAGSSGNKTYTANWTPSTYTVTLDQQGGSGGSSSVTATYNSAMPSATKPTRMGYNFYGYYTSTSGSGTHYYTAGMQSARSYTLTSGTTLYAYWQTAPTISTGTTTSPSLVAGQWYYYKFVPSSSGTYDFQSTASSDTYGYLYDASGNQLVANDDGGNNTNFLVSYNLTANTTYYYAIRWYSSSATGAIPLSLNKQVLTVTLNQQSGSGGTTSVTVENGQPMPSATMPLRMGYNFYGYYTSTSGSGTQYYTAGMQSARNYDKTTSTTLYAYWQTAPTISLGGTPSTPSLVGGQWYFYKFTPSSSGTYVFKSTVSSGDTYGYIYNSSGTQLTYNDDSGDGNNFSISYSFTGGTTYYLAARWYGSTTTGSIPLSLATSLKSNGTSCSTNSECASGYCSGTCQNQPVTYTVSVTNGKVNGSSSVTVNAGTQVTITANADSSSTSSSWSGQNVCSTPSNATNVRYKNQTYSEFSSWNDGNTSRSRTITVNSNLSYTANFNSGTRQVNKQTCKVTSGTVTTDYIYFDRVTYCFNDGSYLYCRTFCDKSVSANVNYNCDYAYDSQPFLINKTFKFPEKTKEWVATYYRGTSSSGNSYPGKSINIYLYSSDLGSKRQLHLFLYRNGTQYAEIDSESSKSPSISYSVPQETIDTRVVGWVDQ